MNKHTGARHSALTTARVALAALLIALAGLLAPNMAIAQSDAADAPRQIPIAFTQQPLEISEQFFTSLTISPDGRLFAATLMGQIYHWQIEPDGTLTDERVIDLYVDRIIVGLLFDSASPAEDPVLWITHNFGVLQDAPNFTGALDRLTVTDYGSDDATWSKQPIIVGLPRSSRDHLSNSLAFGPDGALYLIQGSLSAMGDRDAGWNFNPESLLAAATLRIDQDVLLAQDDLPLDVRTAILSDDGSIDDANNYGYGDPALADNGLYDPLAPDAPVTIYATGFRNAYDLVWHTNGQLYIPVNGSAQGGATPGTPDDLPIQCRYRIDSDYNGPYEWPSVPPARDLESLPDFLARVEPGGYYGHPNPMRCEYAAYGGNPTSEIDPGEWGAHYGIGVTPDRNWRGVSYEFNLHASANGLIEYRSDTFGGALRGKLLVTRYSVGQDIIVLEPGAPNLDIVGVQEGLPGLTDIRNPLDVIEDTETGALYVISAAVNGGGIVLLQPDESGVPTLVSLPTLTIVTYNETWKSLMIAGGVVFGLWGLFSLALLWRRFQAKEPLLPLFTQQALVAIIIVGFTGFVAYDHKYGTDRLSRDIREMTGQQADEPAPDTSIAVAAGAGLEGLAQGEAFFFATCSRCHGTDARGLPGLGPDLVDSEFITSQTDDDLTDFIITGRDVLDPNNVTGIAMPPYGGNSALTRDNILNIVAHLRTLGE